jgi:Predicted O-methyltransferase
MKWRWSGAEGRDLHDALTYACKARTIRSYLEIGVDGGGSLNSVLCVTKPKRIVLCDLFDPTYCNHGDTWPHIKAVLDYFSASAEVLKGDSKSVIPRLRETFDLITVDGDHRAEGATADLHNAWPLLKKGGFLVMDDINHTDYPWLEGVWKQFVRDYGVQVIAEQHGGCNAAIGHKP